MATRTLEILIKANNEAEKDLKSLSSRLESFQPAFKKMATIGTVAFSGIALAVRGFVKESAEAESVQARLNQILRTSTGATDEQIDSLNRQAKALEKVGVVSADVIKQGQGQLASFDLQAESIEKLIPAILNYGVAEKGVNMTSQDLQAVTNGLAQAMQGNFASLTKSGFVLDEMTKSLISNGTEAERVEALTKVLNSTYDGLNETMRNTTEGGIVGMGFAMDDLKQTIGNALAPAITNLVSTIAPIVTRFAEWAERNPELIKTIFMVVAGLTALLAVVGTLGLVLPSIVAGFTFLLSPLGLIILAITALAGLAYLVIQNWTPITAFFVKIFENLKSGILALKEMYINTLNGIKEAFVNVWNAIVGVVKSAIDSITSFLSPIIDMINSVIDGLSRIGQSVGGKIKSIFGGKNKSVNDAIISPNGDIVTTHPDDWLIATKNPNSLGGGSGITVNINGGTYLSEDVAEELGDKIMQRLSMSLKYN